MRSLRRKQPTKAKAWPGLAMYLVLGPIVGSARAQDFTYTTTNGSITITGYKGPGGVVSIPAAISGLPVVEIAASAFDVFVGNTDPASVIIPDSVTRMGAESTGPQNGYVFNECQNLTNIVIGSGLTNIAGPLLWACPKVAAISVAQLNAAYSTQNGVLFNKTATALIRCPPAAAPVLTLPASVTDIRNSACAGCPNLVAVIIPNSVTNVGDSAFWICGITNITLPSGVTKVGNGVFFSCVNLAGVTLPEGITSLGQLAFEDCFSLTSITLPASISGIGNQAFDLCTSLKNVYCKGDAPSQGVSMFYGSTNATVYYLPGTAGWTSSFGGRPTALWNPQVQTNDGSFGVRQNTFGFNIAGTPDIPLAIQASAGPAAASWTELQTCTLTNGLIYFSDAQWMNHRSRLYRLRGP